MHTIKTTRPDWHYLVKLLSLLVSAGAILLTSATVAYLGAAGFTHKGWMYGSLHFAGLLLNGWDFVLFFEPKVNRSVFLFAVNMVVACIMFAGFW